MFHCAGPIVIPAKAGTRAVILIFAFRWEATALVS